MFGKRAFNKTLNQCRLPKRKNAVRLLDAKKVKALSVATRHDMLLYVVRNRGPVLVEMLTPDTDMQWLRSCGYLYKTTGKSGYTFVHTCEHEIH